ncbi:MAG: UvrD-helicase domain-containing protein, partial [Actinomycetota bacterium]|nr:UvrD-helicase domain-containing protein [Actinomycetota bacterium]
MTAPTAWTSEQRTAIERRTGALLVDAAAGSGKTSVLVERFVADVLDGIDVGAILAITFTEKAAAELRDRIRSRLRECGALGAARATEGAWISTIHGFCARMLRAGALAAGLDPAFAVLDSDQSEPLADAAFEAALQELGRSDPGTVALVADYGAGSLRSAIRSIHAQLRSRGQRHPRLPAAPTPPGPETGVALRAVALALAAELGAIDDPGARVIEALARVERCLTVAGVPDEDPWAAELDALRLPSNGPTLSTDACAAYREALSAHRADCATRAAIPVRALLDALLGGFGERYEQAKREVSGVDFADLELLGRDLLRDHAQLRGQYAERFERIMVDELQDTNRVQLELIESIARDNLFTVGDAQQSIYRFRHAEVSLFEERGARLAQSGRRATLATNFRSRPEILTALNTVFAGELGERFRALTAGRPANGAAPVRSTDPRVELLLVDKGADWELEGLAAPWRLAEAEALAARIGQLVTAGTRPGDIVVLMRATTDMRAYERALERHGLPTYVIGGRGYWSHPQVLDLVAYLRVLANPRDEEALHTVLASPLVGASTDALVTLAGAARERGSDAWAVLRASAGVIDGLSGADRDALGAAAGWIPGERVRAQRGGIDTLVDRALVQTGYDLAMLAMPGGPRRLANVRKLMRLGREHEAEHGPDLRGFTRIAAERAAGRAGSSREAEAPIEGDGLDAVRMMTIHRAKGLEFGVVCVADLGRSVRPPFALVRVSADGRLGLRLSRSGTPGRVPALDFDELGREEREAEEAEERRLFYVAMTRARERLVLSGATRFEGWAGSGSTGGGSVAWIAPAFVPELGARIAEGGGDVAVGDAVVRLTLAEKPQAPPRPQLIPAGPESSAGPELPAAPGSAAA